MSKKSTKKTNGGSSRSEDVVDMETAPAKSSISSKKRKSSSRDVDSSVARASKKIKDTNLHDDLQNLWYDAYQNQQQTSQPSYNNHYFELDQNNPQQPLMLNENAKELLKEREQLISKLNALRIIYEKYIHLPSIGNPDTKMLEELKQLERDYNARINLNVFGGFGEGCIIMLNKIFAKLAQLDENDLHTNNKNNRYLILSFQELSRNLMYIPAAFRAPITYITSILPAIQSASEKKHQKTQQWQNPTPPIPRPPPPSPVHQETTSQPINHSKESSTEDVSNKTAMNLPSPPPPPSKKKKMKEEEEPQWKDIQEEMETTHRMMNEAYPPQNIYNQNNMSRHTVPPPSPQMPQFHISSFQR